MSSKTRQRSKTATATATRFTAADDAVEFTTCCGSVEISAAASPEEGKPAPARTVKMIAYTGGAMKVAQLSYPIVVDLSGFDAGNSARPILIDHEGDMDSVLGQTEAIEITAGNVIVTGRVFGESEKAQRVVAMNDKGFKWQASMGFSAPQRQFIAEGQQVKVNGQVFSGPIHVATKTVLGEISFVPLGADDRTSARIAATAAKGTSMDFAKWLEARGFTLADLSDAQKAGLQALYDAEIKAAANKPNPNPNPESGDLNSVLTAERKKAEKRQKIVDLTAKALQDNPGHLPIIEAMSKQAMDGEWDTERYELELLRATRPQSERLRIAAADEGMNNDVITAAVCMAGGLDKPEKAFKEQTLDAASKRFKNGIGLGELLLLFARRNGYDGLSTRNVEPLLRAAFAKHENSFYASAVSNLSLQAILTNTANKFLRQGFDAVESTWRAIAAIRPVRDFKAITSYSLTGDFTYRKVPPGGKLEHAQAGEETYTNQADTYGRMFAADRRDIINDDLGVLTQTPRRLGRGGALKFNDVFWAEFMDNSTFFTTARGNLIEGATPGTNDTRLGIEGLTRAETGFLNSTDPDGNPMGAMPKILLVPNALNVSASTLMNSTEIRDTTASTQFATGNPHQGKFTTVRSSYLSNANLTGYSVVAWYLLADPNDIPVIEVAFLNGQETPTVETADADFNSLGIQFRGYHDFGASLQEYRGGIKMKGSA
jgi:phage major head subunit gpT-like protein